MGPFDVSYDDVANASLGAKKKPAQAVPASPAGIASPPSINQAAAPMNSAAQNQAVKDALGPQEQGPIPSMPTPSGIARNTATNPNPQPVPATIAGIASTPTNLAPIAQKQPTAPVGDSSPDMGKPAALDPFAYRGGASYGAAGPVNGPDSTALTPKPATSVPAVRQQSEQEQAIRAANAAVMNGQQQAVDQSAINDLAAKKPMDIAGMSPEQRFAAAEAYRTGVDKATGVSSTGAGGMPGMKQRFDAYAKDDGILAQRNVREDLLGSGIKLEKNAGGGITITNGGNASNPLGAASGGNSINMAEGNKVMERANAITKSLIDAQPTGGIGILGDGGIQASNDEKTARWRQDEMINKMKYNPGLATLGSAVTASVNGENQRGIAEMNAGITTRGQDLQASNEAKRIAGSPEDKALKQAQAQGILAKTTDDKAIADLRAKAIAGDEKALATMRALAGKTTQASDRYLTVQGGEEIGPDGMTKVKRPSGVFDAQTQKFIPTDAPAAGAAQKAQGTAPKTPQAGEIRGGFKFKGGNPADQSSWEKV